MPLGIGSERYGFASVMGSSPSGLAQSCGWMVQPVSLRDTGNVGEALSVLERVLAIRESVLGSDHQDVGRVLYHIGWALHMDERDRDAIPVYERACGIMERTFGSDHAQTAICLSDWSKVLLTLKEFEPAREKLERSLAIRNRIFPEGHPEVANALDDLGFLHWQSGNVEGASEQYLAAWEMRREHLGPAHKTTLRALNNIALAREREGKPDEAERLLREVAELARAHHGDPSDPLMRALYSRSHFFVRWNRDEDAKAVLREMVSAYPVVAGSNLPRALALRFSLVSLLTRPEEAQEALEHLVRSRARWTRIRTSCTRNVAEWITTWDVPFSCWSCTSKPKPGCWRRWRPRRLRWGRRTSPPQCRTG
jgi:tetratricopeptide (TPR) repeat protein